VTKRRQRLPPPVEVVFYEGGNNCATSQKRNFKYNSFEESILTNNMA